VASKKSVNITDIPLIDNQNLDIHNLGRALGRILYIVNPNNPTGTVNQQLNIEKIIQKFSGIVILDEAYIDFCPELSLVKLISSYSNLVVMHTFSKSYGLAGNRLGYAIANSDLILQINKVKPIFNIPSFNQKLGIVALNNITKMQENASKIIKIRNWFSQNLKNLNHELKVYPAFGNFVYLESQKSEKIYATLLSQNILTKYYPAQNSLRISIGTKNQMKKVIFVIKICQ
jgi:histidinol-phosphate aminotransferase